MEIYKNCNLCPRKCNIDRYKNVGFCNTNEKIKVARASLHYWEEPSISSSLGSGAIFFSGCNLRCVYCQNMKISRGKVGKEITLERLSEIFFELKEKKANNINLVTPSHFVPGIIKAIDLAKKQGFDLPFIYNSGGYESLNTLKMLDGYIDVYLPDFKYMSKDLAKKYSNAPNYPKIAKSAIDEMVRQRGKVEFDKNGIIQKGVIVRHLVLPGHTSDSKEIIKYLYDKYKDNIYMSIMNQYTPLNKSEYENLNRRLRLKEYDSVVDYAVNIGVTNAYIQEGETADESFIPEFDLEGI